MYKEWETYEHGLRKAQQGIIFPTWILRMYSPDFQKGYEEGLAHLTTD